MIQALLQSTAATAASTLPNPVRAVIFDMDGTLLDTEAAHRRAFAETGEAIGWPMADDLLLSMVGIHRDENQRMLAAHLGPDFPLARFYADSDALFEAAVDAGILLRPGARLLLDHPAQAGVPMALATSTAAPYAQQRLEKSGLLHYFDVVVTRSDVDQPKPHAEPYLLAARLLRIDPADCVAVEDSHVGVRSAMAAGIATVMVPDLLPPTEELVLACAQILPSLTDLRDLLLATQ
ncbi:HAD family hydrolase [Sphingobium cupriresistens]|uniref:Haloacid dehalogenase n=1 Tax=Sphingobium cupriresistens LL01 TaxID=1420583 RepID=A0A0J7XRR1_9SPHN|nr:HAD family phosphatase [Sphingobium cupriresistens]KMS54526.1 haloacid dehalogenase [Sphingobium cupriresistens LL01]